jgi:hypothetical protein
MRSVSPRRVVWRQNGHRTKATTSGLRFIALFVAFRSTSDSGKISAAQRTDVEGQGTKSLRFSPLRGGVSREACNKPKG